MHNLLIFHNNWHPEPQEINTSGSSLTMQTAARRVDVEVAVIVANI